jgi:hypothetical protein
MVLIYYIETWENQAFEKGRQMTELFIYLYLLNYLSGLRRTTLFSIGHPNCGRRTMDVLLR